MKKLVLLFACIASAVCINAQDTVALKSGEKLFVKVVANKETSITFTYPGEDLQNEESKRKISYIGYASGRREEIHYGLDLPIINGKRLGKK